MAGSSSPWPTIPKSSTCCSASTDRPGRHLPLLTSVGPCVNAAPGPYLVPDTLSLSLASTTIINPSPPGPVQPCCSYGAAPPQQAAAKRSLAPQPNMPKPQDLRYNTLGSPPIPEQKLHVKPAGPKLQDLNFPSSPSKVPLNLFDETSLELKLVSSSLPSSNYQSVCTLDKVKSALERVKKEPIRKRASFLKSSLSASSPSSI